MRWRNLVVGTFILGAVNLGYVHGQTATPRVLTTSDMVYQGSFAVPRSVNKLSTAFPSTGLAMRFVNGKRQFIAGAGQGKDTGIYEMDFPGISVVTSQKDVIPQAKSVKWWGDIWQGKATFVNPADRGSKRGLYWDEPSKRLYWTYGNFYPASGGPDPSFGWSDISGQTPVSHGPFRPTDGRASPTDKNTKACSPSCQGGIIRIPAWFAAKYTNNKSLGMGFGGYYNIIGSGVSMGPALFATADPDDNTKDYPAVPCVAHTYAGDKPPGLHYAKRSGEYTAFKQSFNSISPVNGVGRWTGMDFIYSAACWVDLPDVSGMVFMPKIQKGDINYQAMRDNAKLDGFDNWIYIYSPADLAQVATGKKDPWTIDPTTMEKFPTPLGGKISGMVFDPGSRTLFILATNAIYTPGENYPIIHAYKIK